MLPGGFRTAYTTQGVSTYYTANSHTYRNPHFPGVVKCIHAILNHLILPPGAAPPETELTVFDCAAGGGEATAAVRGWVGRVMPELLGASVYASDPFTNELYEERVPLPTDDPPPLYIDLTFISFALHLCPPTELFSLLYELSRHSAYLVVIGPHKNPHIPGGGESGWVGPLMEVLVKKERVRGRVFRSVNF
ncbi:hypothetical protein EV426DRAFT_534903 [Tirmania nivea]|nr:hypothetical protein EV426DRAFT_534903 [Tirmania nivea]